MTRHRSKSSCGACGCVAVVGFALLANGISCLSHLGGSASSAPAPPPAPVAVQTLSPDDQKYFDQKAKREASEAQDYSKAKTAEENAKAATQAQQSAGNTNPPGVPFLSPKGMSYGPVGKRSHHRR